jgi:hypothetical protein
MKLKFSQPFESENLTNLFCKSDSQMLCAGFELHLPKSVRIWFGWSPAEYRQHSAGNQTKKGIYFRANRHITNTLNYL